MSRYLGCAAFLVALLAFSSFSSGCRPSVDCDDLGCAFGLVCDAETGECVPEERDCREAPEICTAGEVCDEQSGECRPRVTQCADSGSCPDGQICDAQTGTCRVAVQCSVDGCEAQEVCNPTTDRCEPRPCLEDIDCPTNSGFICGESGLCVRGCRPGSGACPRDQTCLVQTGEGVGVCQDRCVEDTDCAYGQICVEDGDRTQCEAEPPCQLDEDCRADEVCIGSVCSQPRCETDDDCDAGQICQVSSGLCFGGNCAEDQFGNGATRPPNHSRSTAFPLTDDELELSGLILCPGRSDWFRLDVRSTEIVVVRADLAEPGPDVDLYVWDEDGDLLAADTGLGTRAAVRFDGRSNQFVFVEVRPGGSRSLTYDLDVGRDFCPVDTFEENDSYSQATTVPVSVDATSLLELRTCGFDQDWFRLPSLSGSNGLRVELLNGSADLTATLLTPDGETFVIDRETSFFAPRIGTSGDYYVRVLAELGRASEYQLLLESISPASCPNANANASLESAATIAADDPTTLFYCPSSMTGWEVDWITLDPGPGLLLDATVEFSGPAPAADITLVRKDAETVSMVKSVPTSAGSARVLAVLGGDPNLEYFLRVTSNAAVGRLTSFPEYEVVYSLSTP